MHVAQQCTAVISLYVFAFSFFREITGNIGCVQTILILDANLEKIRSDSCDFLDH